MERKITESLLTWKRKPDKQPLVLQGARQVGKTYTLLTFGKRYYKNVAYINLDPIWRIPKSSQRFLSGIWTRSASCVSWRP
jgi:predicted AAA+ superfamily ATPase